MCQLNSCLMTSFLSTFNDLLISTSQEGEEVRGRLFDGDLSM